MEHVTLKPSGIMVEHEKRPKPRELTDYNQQRSLSDYEKALESINHAYESENYDAYEQRIYHAAVKFQKPVWLVEDDATDVRLWGVDCN